MRGLYVLARAAIRVIRNEGWRAFWIKARRRLRWYAPFRRRNPYQLWIMHNEPADDDILSYRQESLAFEYRPLISIIMYVRAPHEQSLRSTIESVLGQAYDNYELFIVCSSPSVHVENLLGNCAQGDRRLSVRYIVDDMDAIDVLNESFSFAAGEFVGFLEQGDYLRPHALFEAVRLLNENPDLDLIYTDDDRISGAGQRAEPFFKPDWSPDLLLSMNYIGRSALLRRELAADLGPLRKGFGASPYYDLLLRATGKTQRIAHIPRVLYSYHREHGSPPESARSADMTALRESLSWRGLDGEVLEGYQAGHYRVRYAINDKPLVSIIIPTRDQSDRLIRCIESIDSKTTYDNYEIVIVDHDSRDPGAVEYLSTSGHGVLRYTGTFNYARMNNIAAEKAKGSYLVFLNNDTEVIEPAWLEAMLEQAQRPEVGMVGCLLLYPPGTPLADTVQHAGVVIGIGIANHIFRFRPASSPGYFGLHRVIRNCSAVTAACAMIRKSLFKSVGGFDESFAVAFNDIDLCLRLRQEGLLIVYTPFAVLYHHEGATRGAKAHPEDDSSMLTRWRDMIAAGDPYYSRNLSLLTEDCTVAAAPCSCLPLAVLLDIYSRRPDLQRAYPEARRGDYQRLVDWAAIAGMSHDGVRSPLLPYASWYAGHVSDGLKPLASLLEMYSLRYDLQREFPEVLQGHYQRFVTWAAGTTDEEQP